MEEIKLPLLADDMTISEENPKEILIKNHSN